MTRSSTDNPPTPTVGADAPAAPCGGVALSTNTLASDADVRALPCGSAEPNAKGATRIECAGDRSTLALMAVKQGRALVIIGIVRDIKGRERV